MFKYIVKRILSSILVLLGVVTITFFIARVLPSNPEVKWAGQRATPEQLEAARIELGLDKSLPEQYIIYLGDLLHGDLGKSLNNHQPVTAELARYIPATLELVLLAFGLVAMLLVNFLSLNISSIALMLLAGFVSLTVYLTKGGKTA